jgi:hypothetical protein
MCCVDLNHALPVCKGAEEGGPGCFVIVIPIESADILLKDGGGSEGLSVFLLKRFKRSLILKVKKKEKRVEKMDFPFLSPFAGNISHSARL